jgi:hypothetical protein
MQLEVLKAELPGNAVGNRPRMYKFEIYNTFTMNSIALRLPWSIWRLLAMWSGTAV